MEYLNKIRSDHSPLLLFCGGQSPQLCRPFKFLMFWTKKEDFKDMVQQNQTSKGIDYLFVDLMVKMKKTKIVLSFLSREKYGDIFKPLRIREEIMSVKEDLFEEHPITANKNVLQKAHVELSQYL